MIFPGSVSASYIFSLLKTILLRGGKLYQQTLAEVAGIISSCISLEMAYEYLQYHPIRQVEYNCSS